MRFPILYITFFAIAFFFEVIRLKTYRQLKDARNNYEYLYGHDALTGALQRYGFKEIRYEQVVDFSYALAMLDIDNFKEVNDTYGHQDGDTVLKEFANIIQNTIKDDGTLCRWGGEEFIILYKDSKKALDMSNNVLTNVRNNVFNLSDNKTCQITVSIGLVFVKENEKVDYDTLIDEADENLYKAKAIGKDKLLISNYENR